ncbi:unnamed protein product [Coregonus sp. 'balchen']|nr:unnamed protein product [Coregonus sp. 'balchen']
MKTFCGRANPATGALDWVEESEEYDYHQEIARVKARGEKVIVLDIGTGTGLLSMMAVTAGADYCYAVEVFKPMADAALRIVKKNGFSDKIKIINKHSTEVTIGLDGDMQTRANVLITELWAQLQPMEVDGRKLLPPPAVSHCAGAHSVCDIQLSQVPPHRFTPLGPLCTMFSVDFSKPVSSAPQSHSSSFPAQSSGRAQVVLSWWDIDMDPSGSIVCSMAPSWTYPDPQSAPWRDHWMQSVYFLPVERRVAKGEELSLTVSHDDYSLWYSLQPDGQQGTLSEVPPCRPCCVCQAHLVWTRTRFGELNDHQRTQSYVSALRSVVKPDSVCVGVSDGSLLPVFAHMLGAKKVFSLENSGMLKQVIEQVLDANSMRGGVQILGIRPDQLSMLIGEPYFSTSLLPWHSLYFWYCRTALVRLLTPNATILPCSATLCIVAVEFQDLWRIRAPCGTCEGFDVGPMDEMIQQSLDFRESREAEPQPLWEYPCRALTQPKAVMTFDFLQCVPEQPIRRQGSLPLTRRGRCHGVALWMEYQLNDDVKVSMGLMRPVSEEGACEWSLHRKQGVYFFRSPWESSGDGRASVSYSFTFEPSIGDIKMDFAVASQ